MEKEQNSSIKPLPPHVGTGFVSFSPLPAELAGGYVYQQQGIYHNYHFTSENYHWPQTFVQTGEGMVIDGFSPNLNKFLHVGHLMQLAIANAVGNIFPDAKTVAMLGGTLGELPGALDDFQDWCKFVGYCPQTYLDHELEAKISTSPGSGDQTGCKVWQGPQGPVIVVKSNGQKTYAYHDLAFAQLVKPTAYLTGAEQKQHFTQLGLADKHIPIGLLLNADGKKMSSSGGFLSAKEALELAISKLKPTQDSKKLAWNAICWQFLKKKLSQNLNWDIDNWTKIESEGVYISYTFAKVSSIFAKYSYYGQQGQFDGDQLSLIGLANYFPYYLNMSMEKFDPSFLAHFAYALAKKLAKYYDTKPIGCGSPQDQYVVFVANSVLKMTMQKLGMFTLESV